MKRLKTIYTLLLLLAVALPLLTACSSDDATGENNPRKDGKVTVRLRLSQAAPAMTRAEWEDKNATDDEMMNVWTVVITDEAGNVKHILTGKPTNDKREIDPIETDLELETGTYNFYSFANIEASNLATLLGFAAGTVPAPVDGTVQKNGPITNIKFPANGTLNDYTAKVNGNLFNSFNSETNNNGFGSYGIPMSNMQKIEVKAPVEGAKAQVIDLIVVRMLAKIKLQIYNDKASAITIESITLTDITKNASDNGDKANLKLFPHYTYTNGDENVFPGADEKVDYKHGDIRPNLTNEATKDVLKITPSSSGVTVLSASSASSNPSNPSDPSDPLPPSSSWTIPASNYSNGGAPLTITFYVNESENPTGENWGATTSETPQQFNHYFLKIKINGEEERYTLIDDNGTKEGEKWNYIARNDYRIIPIVLDDYKLDMIPYDFPAIGVYPASMKEEDGIYTITFHDYGHFHLQPKVTKYSTPKKVVPYGSSSATDDDKTYWTLVESGDDDFSKAGNKSWGSWTDATKTTEYKNEDPSDIPFYRIDSSNPLSSQTKDGDDAGGFPVWYPNTPSTPSDPSSPETPRWASDWAPNSETNLGYQPFIFGYIADPKGKLTNGDKKVYHEFSINLYKEGTSAARQMTYRLYMILDQDQMMYRSRALGAPAARHTHGH